MGVGCHIDIRDRLSADASLSHSIAGQQSTRSNSITYILPKNSKILFLRPIICCDELSFEATKYQNSDKKLVLFPESRRDGEGGGGWGLGGGGLDGGGWRMQIP